MNDSKRTPVFLIVFMLLLLFMILVFQGLIVSKLYVDQHPESRLAKIAEHVDELEDTVENKVKKLEHRISPEPASDSESADPSGGKTDEAENHLLPVEGWNPFQEMRSMREQVDKMFGHSLERFQKEPGFDDSWLKDPYMPASDFESKEDHYLVSMDIPGIDKSNLEVSIEGLLLRIKGQRDELIKHEEDGDVLRTERLYGQFLRSFTMPGGIDPENATAEYKDGVLTVTIPKGEKTHVNQKIEVK